jgi:hypothetical protein
VVLWHLVIALSDLGPAGLLAGTAAAAAMLLAAVVAAYALLRRAPASPNPRVSTRALRERSDRTGVPRHRDPDASGRSRPRAPTPAYAAG